MVVFRPAREMLPPFDIFRVEPDGEVLWVKEATDFKSARQAVKDLMQSAPGEYVIHSHGTGNDLRVKPPRNAKKTKRMVFQIAYDQTLMVSRAELLKGEGFEVVSVLGNEAAKAALTERRPYSLFIIGAQASAMQRREMAEWIKAKYPDVPILALNPPYHQKLEPADYNVILNGPEEWLFIAEATTA